MPFISDDWVTLATLAGGVPLRTPFGYLRPLYLGSYWAELRLWGMRPVAFHLTNVLLIAACAAMLVVLVRKLGGDRGWATAAGTLFALHPYHVENAAWIAARADVASTALVLLGLLAYERWARDGRGAPLGAIAAFEAALLFKESVVFFPAAVVVLRALSTRSRLGRSEWLKGILPLGLLAAVHFLVVRQVFLGDAGLRPLQTLGLTWLKRGADFFTAAVLPIHAERIEARPALFLALALAIVGVLVALAWRHVSGRAYEAGALVLLFAFGVAPSLLSFQERYLFLPSAASAVVLAYLLLRIPKRVAPIASVVLLAVWLGSLATHWHSWLEAGRASERLIRGLAEASQRDGVSEIVVANLPYRVAGAPLAGDLSAAVRLSGGRDVRVRWATALNLPDASASGIEPPWSDGPDGVRLRIRMPRGVFSGVFLPLDRPPGTTRTEDFATLTFETPDSVLVTLPRSGDGTRAAYAWHDGTLKPLF